MGWKCNAPFHNRELQLSKIIIKTRGRPIIGADIKHKVTSPTNQRGKLKAVSHREHLLTGAASVITHQLSLKGKAAADVAEVAKHLNITYDVRDAENAGGIAECSHIMEFTV